MIPAFGLAVALALLVVNSSRQNLSRTQRLPDGSFLKVVGVSYGTNHNYAEPVPRSWQKQLARTLPFSWTRRFGWYDHGHGSIGMFNLHGETNLAIATTCEQATATSFTASPRVVAFDEQGNSFDAAFGGGSNSGGDGTHHRHTILWSLAAFPRRTETIGLRFLELAADGKTWQPLAEFHIPNPAGSQHPSWTPEPWPTTKTDDDLAVTLIGLKAGLSKQEPMRAAAANETAATRALFRVQQTGPTNVCWRAKSIEVSDATGNRWSPGPGPASISLAHEGETEEIIFPGALWPGESAWKLRVEFSRMAGFDADELWTVRGVMVPGATQTITLDNATTIHDTKLTLLAITGENAKQLGLMRWEALPKHANISIHADPIPKGRRLALVKVVDDQGREVDVQPGTDWSQGENVFGLTIPQDAKLLDCTFALHKSRFVEFLAKPEFVPSKAETK
ncbi:MAG: hypothetical protein JWR69_3391 [Pedosphaera sp.]|nr:hypothetical protein [Pedosphaera sp.]